MANTTNRKLIEMPDRPADASQHFTNELRKIDAILGSTVSKSMAAGNVTLTETETAQNLVLQATGVLTANRDLLLDPDVKGLWVFWNNASGAFDITVKPTGGAGVTFDDSTQGGAYLIFSNGTVAISVGQVSGGGAIDADTLEGHAAAYFATDADLDTLYSGFSAHIANTSNPHTVTKSQVGLGNVTNDAQLAIANNLSDLANAGTARNNIGLGNVNNTADTAKPISVTQQAALDLKRDLATRVVSEASNATPTPNADTTDQHVITAQAAAAAFAAPSGTPTNGQKLIICIKDNGTARALSWNAIYRASSTPLPTTTEVGKTTYVGFMYNSTDTKWDNLGPETKF